MMIASGKANEKTTALEQAYAVIERLMTLEDCEAVGAALRARFNALLDERAIRTIEGLHVGDRVSFDSKSAGSLSGQIVKINVKSVQVMVDGGARWFVSPLLLRPDA